MDTFDSGTGLDMEGNHLESIPRLVKSFTNVAPVISPADAQASEKLCQLAEIIGGSRTLPGTVGLSAFVVDAAPCNASAMSQGSLATLIQEDDTESKEPAARCHQDSLLERVIRTGWERDEEGERDVDLLNAAAMEATEGDVTDYDMCMDLIQTIQEVFDHAIFQ